MTKHDRKVGEGGGAENTELWIDTAQTHSVRKLLRIIEIKLYKRAVYKKMIYDQTMTPSEKLFTIFFREGVAREKEKWFIV